MILLFFKLKIGQKRELIFGWTHHQIANAYRSACDKYFIRLGNKRKGKGNTSGTSNSQVGPIGVYKSSPVSIEKAIKNHVELEGMRNSHLSTEQKDGLPVDIKLPVKHILSKELQLYFDKITELVVSRSSTVLFKKALVSLATDSGLHPLVPYFTYFIADEVMEITMNWVTLRRRSEEE